MSENNEYLDDNVDEALENELEYRDSIIYGVKAAISSILALGDMDFVIAVTSYQGHICVQGVSQKNESMKTVFNVCLGQVFETMNSEDTVERIQVALSALKDAPEFKIVRKDPQDPDEV